MLRTFFYSMVLLLPPLIGAAMAEDKKEDKPVRPQVSYGTVVKVDADKHSVTLKVRSRDNKEQEKTVELKEGVKLIGPDGKEDKEAHFLKELHAGDHVLVTEKEGKVVEVRDLPARPRGSFGTVVKVDAASHTITFKVRGRDGKEEEKTVTIKEGVKLIGEDGKEDKEAHFLKELKPGELIQVTEREGKVVEVRDLPERPNLKYAGAAVKVDADKHTITLKVKGKDGKEEEKTVEIKEGVKVFGKDGKEGKLADIAAGTQVMVFEKEGKLDSVRVAPSYPRMIFGAVVKVDADKHTITLKVRGRDNKEEEKTVAIKEGVKLIGEDGKEDKEGHFLKELKPGENILVTEREGKVVEIRDFPERRRPNKPADKPADKPSDKKTDK